MVPIWFISTILLITGCVFIYLTHKEANKITDPIERTKKGLILKKGWGIGIAVLGTANLIDLSSPFPIPLVGPEAIGATILLYGISGYLLWRYYSPKVNETLLLAEKLGVISIETIMTKLGISYNHAVKTINAIELDHMAVVLNPDEPNIANRFYLIRGTTLRTAATRRGDPTHGVDGDVRESYRTRTEGRTPEEINRMILDGQMGPQRPADPPT
jgi:hypothetical protein